MHLPFRPGQVATAALYVSSDLAQFEAPPFAQLGKEIEQQDADRFRVYRRLDRRWFAWLVTRYRQALTTLPPASHGSLHARFAPIAAWAHLHWSTKTVTHCTTATLDDQYQPPAKPRHLAEAA